MKAYIDVQCVPTRNLNEVDPKLRYGTEFRAEVVSEQDHHKGGPWAHSHRTSQMLNRDAAYAVAAEWAAKNGYTIVTSAEEL